VIASIKHGIPFQLEGAGKSKRAFCHVRDVCNAIWRIMLCARSGSAWNIAPKMDVQPISHVVTMICEQMGVKFKDAVMITPKRPGQDNAYRLHTEDLRFSIGWEDSISLEEGIAEVIAWMNKDWESLKNEPMNYQG
jgi:dTDP-glucose 4,6-dehydratase